MQYKTTILYRLKAHPTLYRRLHKKRLLTTTLEVYADKLRERHQEWQQQLSQLTPRKDVAQLASAAMQIALKELEYPLLSGAPPEAVEPLSLGEAMLLLKHHTPLA